MGRSKLGIEDQIFSAIKKGYATNAQLAKYLRVGQSVISKTCTDMVIAGIINSSRSKHYVYYSIAEQINAHDPFRLCRTPSEDQKTGASILSSQTKTGFGNRIQHFIEDAGRSDAPKTGDGASHAYRYGQPKELRDIL